jgi:predicted helicase
MVVLGNPPYSGISANMAEKITQTIEPYRFVDGKPLGERKLWLQDDYVKFIRFGQTRIDETGEGILAFITNHSYLDNPTFRGMRQSLMKTFDTIYILDLHGNSKQKKSAPGGVKDENVFAIQQGVAIAIFIKHSKKRKQTECVIRHSELWGERELMDGKTTGGKYNWLLKHDIKNTEWTTLTPDSPFYFYIPQLNQRKKETEQALPIVEVMPRHGLGYQTSRDSLVIDFDSESLEKKIERFIDSRRSDADVRNEFFPGKTVRDYLSGDTRQWSLTEARNELRNRDWRKSIRRTLYRPFDFRYCLYDEKMVDWPRPEMLGHLLGDGNDDPNLGLVIGRQGDATGSSEWDVAFVASDIFDQNIFRRGGGSLFPFKLVVPNGNGSLFTADGERFNISQTAVSTIANKLDTSISPQGGRSRLSPWNIFTYCYAILNSQAYRKRFAVSLRRDFPSIPFSSNIKLFRKLSQLGEQLVKLHLMEKIAKQFTKFPKKGSDEVEYIKYDEETGRVQINDDQYFEGVPDTVWNFHIGGYQVAQKWLKDRKNRKLDYDDIKHYHNIISALSETTRLMKEIDEVIADAGGFPLK